MTFTGCPVCHSQRGDDGDCPLCDKPWGPIVRGDAHRALDRWLDEAEREAPAAHAAGRSGYLGRIKLCAFVDDAGITLRIERSFSEGL